MQHPPQAPNQEHKIAARVVLGILAIIIGGFVLLGPVADFIFPNAIKGQFIDAVYLPDGRVWFQTDGSFYYTLRTESPGRSSMSTESLFNKSYSYFYDPVKGEVLQKTRQDFDATPPHPSAFYGRDGIWLFTPLSGKHQPNVQVLNPETGEVTMNLQQFIDKFYGQLESGIAELSVNEDLDQPVFVNIKTQDGQDFVYDVAADRLRASPPDAERKTFVFASDGARKTLPQVRGRVFLEGVILYQDSEVAVILEQDQVGKGARRLLTAVGANGDVLWMIPQEELFSKLAIDDNDSFSAIFFVKNYLHAERQGGLFLLSMDNVGMMAIDLKTGMKQWELRP